MLSSVFHPLRTTILSVLPTGDVHHLDTFIPHLLVAIGSAVRCCFLSDNLLIWNYSTLRTSAPSAFPVLAPCFILYTHCRPYWESICWLRFLPVHFCLPNLPRIWSLQSEGFVHFLYCLILAGEKKTYLWTKIPVEWISFFWLWKKTRSMLLMRMVTTAS